MDSSSIYQTWLDKGVRLKSELLKLQSDSQKIEESFSSNIKFGTAGLRGIVGVGTNKINIYTIGHATQAVAQWLLETDKKPTVAIAYDSRNDSKEFALRTAEVFAGNRIRVKLFKEVTPTPVLAHYVRENKITCGIVITASHNPSQYNGYKVYEKDGGQLRSQGESSIEGLINQIDMFDDVKSMDEQDALGCGLLSYIGKKEKQDYIKNIVHLLSNHMVESLEDISVVYTPLNGAGAEYLPDILKKIGVSNIHLVEQQAYHDGNFPTCPYPNPESLPALELGLKLCETVNPDIFIATDPDADRVRIGINHNGKIELLDGNTMGILLLDYICMYRQKSDHLGDYPIFIRTVVSSLLCDKVAQRYGVSVEVVLTGFKNIARRIAQLEEKKQLNRFIFAYEESIGFLPNVDIWDKDGLSTSILFIQMVAYYKSSNITIIDRLEEIYSQLGYYYGETLNFSFDGINADSKMQDIMDGLRKNPPHRIGDIIVNDKKDYLQEKDYLKSNIIEFSMTGETKVIIRPSGTEPKIKVYIMTIEDTKEKSLQTTHQLKQGINNIMN